MIPVLALHSLTGLGASSELYLLLRPSGHPRTGTQLPFGKADQTLNTTNGIHLLLASEFTFSDIRKWLSAQRPFWPLATRCQLINLEGGLHVGFFSFSDTKSPTFVRDILVFEGIKLQIFHGRIITKDLLGW